MGQCVEMGTHPDYKFRFLSSGTFYIPHVATAARAGITGIIGAGSRCEVTVCQVIISGTLSSDCAFQCLTAISASVQHSRAQRHSAPTLRQMRLTGEVRRL